MASSLLRLGIITHEAQQTAGRSIMIKHKIFLCFLFLWWTPFVFSQETSILQSYQREFTRADLSAKAEILQDAADDEQAAEFIGPLYEFALRFALANADILGDDPEMIHLAGVAAKGAGSAGFKETLDTLWEVFSSYRDSRTRVAIFGALEVLGKGNGRVIENLNQYLDSQNKLFHSGTIPDYPALSACVAALAQLGDSSSFPALFAAVTAGYPENITGEIAGALNSIPGNYLRFLLNIILKNPPAEKLAAFKAGISGRRFSPAEQGQLAEAALEQGLSYFPGTAGEIAILSEMRYESALTLTRLRWSRASAQAVRHFYRVQTDFQQGIAPRERFLEAIHCLGAMGTSEAALALGLQLGLYNAQTEKTGGYDEDLTLALVGSLGRIGDKSAFDYLLYISYLPYTDQIQAAAKEALNRLRW
jgi:hypothetical protein